MPRWGLRDAPPRPAAVVRGRFAALLERRDRLLVATAIVFALAALAEFVRYGILLYNRTRLVSPVGLILSDIAVYVTAVLSLLLALAAALALVAWLVDARRTAYARAGSREPRTRAALWGGCLIPVVNLVYPGVYLSELVARRGGDLRVVRAVRIWWGAWVLNGVLVAAALLWRSAGSLQAQADGVVFTAYTDLAAAAVAVLSLWVVRLIEGRDLRGRIRLEKRWLAAVSTSAPVIEPVHPVAESDGRAPDAPVGKNDGSEPAVDAETEHEEVMAK
nr:DUF4328 domain-containing protein [Nocardia transvalensis]